MDECYTAGQTVSPAFRKGKVNHLARWREQNPTQAQAADTWFYPIHIMTRHCSRTWVIPCG